MEQIDNKDVFLLYCFGSCMRHDPESVLLPTYLNSYSFLLVHCSSDILLQLGYII